MENEVLIFGHKNPRYRFNMLSNGKRKIKYKEWKNKH